MSLINFSLVSADNGRALCHAEFDRSGEPGFLFLSIDIPFFINFELRDQRRRAAEEIHGRKVNTKYVQRVSSANGG
ncbi:hypothetical protein BDV37DRAFT_251328 [Aspergillus pseudonomiae]|uniref:Uncharacterized protein n=1 Tax=Aspergillus pseudonomiae TaxID=1506151 RepID=A0A5N7D985_9EURO|nr:uncharacterized protein BDV37DRAFT_251328 [Aspergillus pseudonomiae]KAE8403010.1 hypothetical protein BDV37DRAFT_251328 [Aspergillus pseudonomiae]